MQSRIGFRFKFNFRQFTGQVENGFQIALHIIEINGLFCQVPMLFVAVTADDPSQHHILTDAQRCLGIRYETQTGFKNTHAVLLTILVVHSGRQQASQQRQAHRGHFAGDWAWQNQRFFTRVNPLLYFRVNEAIGDHFLIAFVVQHSFHALKRQIGLFVAPHHKACLYRLIRDAVIAINTRDFFHQVFFDFHIETPGRRNGQPLVLTHGDFTTQTRQNISNQIVSNVMTNQTIKLATAQRNRGALRQACFIGNINNWARFTTAQLKQQTGCTFHRLVLQSRIDAAFIAVRSISVQTMTTRAASNRQWAKESGLQQNVLGFIVHTRMFTAKDTGHGQRFVVVCNHQRICVQFCFSAVQQNQRFTLFGHANFDPTFDTIFIECMHRLAQFQQHVVGDIDNGINRADAATTQFLFHPQRRWCFDVDAFNDAAQIAWASICGFNIDRQHIRNSCHNRRNFWRIQRQLVQHGNITRHTDDT